MLSLSQFLKLVNSEFKIVKHLITCVPEDQWDFRPTPGQRSILETAQYLAFAPYGAASYVVTDDWAEYSKGEAAASKLGPDELIPAIDAEAEKLRALVGTLTEDKLTDVTRYPTGAEATWAEALVEMTLKWLTAYRMQLFLFIKEAGRDDLWTPDCWVGETVPKPEGM